MSKTHKKNFHSFLTKNGVIKIDASFSSFEEAHQLRADNRSVGYSKSKNLFIHIFTTRNRKKDKTFPENTQYYYGVYKSVDSKYSDRCFLSKKFDSIADLLKDFKKYEKSCKKSTCQKKSEPKIRISDDGLPPINFMEYFKYCSAIRVQLPREEIVSIPNLREKIQWEFEEANDIFNDFIKEKEKALLESGRFLFYPFIVSVVLFFSSIAGTLLAKNPLIFLLTLLSFVFLMFIGNAKEKIDSKLEVLETRKKSETMTVPKDVYTYGSGHIYLKNRLLERLNDESIVSIKEEKRYQKLIEDLKANHEKIIYGKCRIEEQNLEDFFRFAENSDEETLEKFAKQKKE